VLLAALGVTGGAQAQGSQDLKEACAASYEQAQTLRRAAKLTLAGAQLAVCQETCPAALSRDCRRWTEEIDREMPRLSLSALDRNGAPLSGVELSVDGELTEMPAEGAALRLDPGRHRLVLRFGDERHAREVVLAARAQQQLSVEFDVVRAPEPVDTGTGGDPTRDRSGELVIPPAAWALGAVGVVGLGAGLVLGIKGHVDRSELRSSCAPACEQEDVDAIQRDWTIGAVAAGVGAVATGVAIWLVIDENQTRVALRPIPGGAVGALGGSF
jgi:hypothetical protein